MSSTPPIRLKILVPSIAALTAGALLIDDYFSKEGGGGLGAAFLGLFGAGGIVMEFLSGLGALRHPRTLDLAYVAGADLAWRRLELRRSLVRTGTRQALLIVPSAAAMSLWLHPSWQEAALLIAATAATLLVSGLMAWLLVPRIPPSKGAFPGEAGESRPIRLRWAREVIRITAALAGNLRRAMPEPYGSLASRKALYLLRTEGDLMVVAALAFGTLGMALIASRNPAFTGAGALAAAALSCTWFRFQSALPDAHLRACVYYAFPPREAYRGDLILAVLLTSPFLLYLVIAFLRLEGARALIDIRLGQLLLTVLLFAQMAAADGLRPGMSPNTLLLLNLGYLGVSGILFLLPPGLAMGALASVLVLSHLQAMAPGNDLDDRAVPGRISS